VSKLEIELERDRQAPGDAVRGSVLVVEGGESRKLDISLVYLESTEDYSGSAIEVAPVTVNQGELQKGQSHEFSLDLPADAPPGFDSRHGKMHWTVIAKSDELGPDTVETKRFAVSA
jgi:hypothetical protein